MRKPEYDQPDIYYVFRDVRLARERRQTVNRRGWIFKDYDNSMAVLFPSDMHIIDVIRHPIITNREGYFEDWNKKTITTSDLTQRMKEFA